jgi:hypothetical protein
MGRAIFDLAPGLRQWNIEFLVLFTLLWIQVSCHKKYGERNDPKKKENNKANFTYKFFHY